MYNHKYKRKVHRGSKNIKDLRFLKTGPKCYICLKSEITHLTNKNMLHTQLHLLYIVIQKCKQWQFFFIMI